MSRSCIIGEKQKHSCESTLVDRNENENSFREKDSPKKKIHHLFQMKIVEHFNHQIHFYLPCLAVLHLMVWH